MRLSPHFYRALIYGQRLLLLVACSLSFVGCTSHLYNVSAQKKAPTIARPYKGTVVPTDERKTTILKASGIVAGASGHRTVRLTSLKTFPSCGMPLLITYFSFGLVPGIIPADKAATIEVVDHQKTTITTYDLRLLYGYSLWENLNFLRHDDAAISRALAWAYQNGETTRRLGPTRRFDFPP